MTDPINDRVIAMISSLANLPVDQIEPASRLDELEIDSLVIVELSLKLKQEFSISEEADQKLDNAETIQDIIDLVKASEANRNPDGVPSTEPEADERTNGPSS